jgi:hypothetical protein
MRRTNEKGNALLFALIAMTFMSVLGTGVYYLTSTSSLNTLGAMDENLAVQLAFSGINHAMANNLSDTTVQYPQGREYVLDAGINKFILVINCTAGRIESTGIAKAGTPYEVKYKIAQTMPAGFCSRSDVSFAKDIQSFTAPSQSQSGFITTDTSAAQISLGKIGMGSTFGALWYQGSAVPGNCTGGKCDFGAGFRAFFVFQFAAGMADGFTFTFFNGDTATNDVYSVGGHTDRGELMGYAGNSRSTTASTGYLDLDKRVAAGCPSALGCGDSAKGRGIQPPKVAIEFDPYRNQCSCSSDCTNEKYCSTNCTVCESGSRCDGGRDHMAYVFWGDNSNNCVFTVGKNTYDDNKHGAGTEGSSAVPQNSRSPISSGGQDTTSYYNNNIVGVPTHWLYDYSPRPIYAFRVEVTRSLTVNAGGNYDYTIKSWLKQCSNDITCPDYGETSDYANTKTDYTTEAPTLNKTISLNLTLHEQFSTFFHGWTTATGGETQNILINRHKINFRN